MSRKRKKSRPQSVGDILPDVMDGLGLSERLEERRLLDAWAEVVGEQIAGHSRAVDLQQGVLVLQADHAAWRQELVLLIPQIIARYNEKFGAGTVRQVIWDRPLPGHRGGRGRR